MSSQQSRKKDERVDDPQELRPEEEAVEQVLRESGGWHSTEVAFALLTQLPRVRISALPFLFTAKFEESNEIESIWCQSRDFAKQLAMMS